MRHILLLNVIVLFFAFGNIKAQVMNSKKLKELIVQVSDTVIANGNSLQFSYNKRPLICVYDENANRMRIISPITERVDIGEEELLNALVANFHSVLDVKYALSDEVIWSVFIHPLKELTEKQVLDAIDQVYRAATTFGTTYSSTDLVFPGNTKKREKTKPKKLMDKG